MRAIHAVFLSLPLLLSAPSSARAEITLERLITNGEIGLDREHMGQSILNLNNTGGFDVVRCDTCPALEIIDLATGSAIAQITPPEGMRWSLIGFADLDQDGVREAVLERGMGGAVPPPPGGKPVHSSEPTVFVVDPFTGVIELQLGDPTRDYSVRFLGDLDGDSHEELAALCYDYNSHQACTEIYGPDGSTPLGPEVSLSASPLPDGGILLTWTTYGEPPAVGFHLWRQGDDGPNPPERITATPIPSGAAYQYEDHAVALGREYRYWVEALFRDGSSRRFGPVAARPAVGAPIRIGRNAPNPFPVSTEIPLTMATRATISLRVFDVGGRLVKTLHRGTLDAGPHLFTWDGKDDAGSPVASGAYFYRVATLGESRAEKMLLLR